MDYWILSLFIICFDLKHVSCLFVTDLNVPEIVDFRDNVTLSCSYDMNGNTLNSVKWYKDRHEFFRYSPMMHPVYMKFHTVGVQVQENKYYCNELNCRVELGLLSAKSTGVYKCEVSGDAPHFKLADRAANMTVAALPQSDPLIEHFNSMYRIEEYMSATCASDYSSLPTRLTWLINGEPAKPGELQPSIDNSITAHDYILRRQKLQINLYLTGLRFLHAGNTLELKCVADIENFPELRRERRLTATLMHSDNLNNQMLIYAVNSGLSVHNKGEIFSLTKYYITFPFFWFEIELSLVSLFKNDDLPLEEGTYFFHLLLQNESVFVLAYFVTFLAMFLTIYA